MGAYRGTQTLRAKTAKSFGAKTSRAILGRTDPPRQPAAGRLGYYINEVSNEHCGLVIQPILKINIPLDAAYLEGSDAVYSTPIRHQMPFHKNPKPSFY